MRRRGGGHVTVPFYREECKIHGVMLDVCDDQCEISEKEYQVTGYVSAYDPGVCSGPPDRCYPPEGGEVEDMEVTLDGKAVDDDQFTPVEFDKMAEALAEAAADMDDYDDGPDDYDDGPPDSFDPPDYDGF